MKPSMKVGIVLAGYALAFIASVVTVAIFDRRFTAADNQGMGGMIAGSEMILGVGVFLLVALVPTFLALWFIRRSRRAWTWLKRLALGFTILVLAAVGACALARFPMR